MLLILGLAWVAADRVLTRSYPDTWGGSNIGAGLLLLLAYLSIAAGLVTPVFAVVTPRKSPKKGR